MGWATGRRNRTPIGIVALAGSLSWLGCDPSNQAELPMLDPVAEDASPADDFQEDAFVAVELQLPAPVDAGRDVIAPAPDAGDAAAAAEAAVVAATDAAPPTPVADPCA